MDADADTSAIASGDKAITSYTRNIVNTTDASIIYANRAIADAANAGVVDTNPTANASDVNANDVLANAYANTAGTDGICLKLISLVLMLLLEML